MNVPSPLSIWLLRPLDEMGVVHQHSRRRLVTKLPQPTSTRGLGLKWHFFRFFRQEGVCMSLFSEVWVQSSVLPAGPVFALMAEFHVSMKLLILDV